MQYLKELIAVEGEWARLWWAVITDLYRAVITVLLLVGQVVSLVLALVVVPLSALGVVTTRVLEAALLFMQNKMP